MVAVGRTIEIPIPARIKGATGGMYPALAVASRASQPNSIACIECRLLTQLALAPDVIEGPSCASLKSTTGSTDGLPVWL